MIADQSCRFHGCTSPRQGRGSFCMKHQKQKDRYGHPAAPCTPLRDLVAYRPFVEAGMARYANSKALHAALRLTEDLLNYTPVHGFTVELQIAERTRWLREHRSPHAVLQRVVEFYAVVNARPERFPNVRAERFGLARAVLQLGAPDGRPGRPSSVLLNYFGAHIVDALGPFALAFLQRLSRDASERRALITVSSTAFEEPVHAAP